MEYHKYQWPMLQLKPDNADHAHYLLDRAEMSGRMGSWAMSMSLGLELCAANCYL